MSVSSLAYRALFKRTPTLLLVGVTAAVVFERGIDVIGESIFNWYNRGLLWDDIKDNYKK